MGLHFAKKIGVDFSHLRKWREGITSPSAEALANISKAYPKLAGKLTGNAIRVPTPNVSLAILNLNLKTSVDRLAVNEFLRDTALFSKLQHQIDYTASKEIVSTDLVASRAASVVDSQATIAADNRLTLYVWYDNEFGYSCQVIRILQHMSNVQFLKLPRQAS